MPALVCMARPLQVSDAWDGILEIRRSRQVRVVRLGCARLAVCVLRAALQNVVRDVVLDEFSLSVAAGGGLNSER